MDNRLLAFAKLALHVAERVLPERAHKFAPKTYTQPQLFACVLLKEYLRLDYRTAQEVLDASDRLRRVLGLRRAPDYSTLWHFVQEKLTPELIEQSLAETVRLLQGPAPPSGGSGGSRESVLERAVAVDSTGLETAHASRHFESRRAGQPRRSRSWIKWAGALWMEPQLLLSQLVREAPSGDCRDLVPLAQAASRVLPFGWLVADAGYDSEANHRLCREQLGLQTLIPAKGRRSNRVIARTPYRRQMLEVLGPAGDPLQRHLYARRWLVETLMSVLKRKWGEALSARREAMQMRQARLRGLVYNLYRLVVLRVQPA